MILTVCLDDLARVVTFLLCFVDVDWGCVHGSCEVNDLTRNHKLEHTSGWAGSASWVARTSDKARPGCTPNGFAWWYKERHGVNSLNVSRRRPGSKRSNTLGEIVASMYSH